MLNGVNVALLTPETQDGKIDVKSGLKLAESLVQAGVDGLFLLGTNGEGIRFSVDERIRYAKTILQELNRKGVKICVHTGASSVEETRILSQAAYNDGADDVALITPYMLCYDESELYEHYKAVIEALPDDISIYIYNIPQRTGNDVSAALLKRLKSEYPNVAGIKYSYNDLNRTMEYLGIENCSVLHGSDIYQMQYLSMGCDGIISGLCNVFPEPFCRVRDAWRSGDIESARRWQRICFSAGELLEWGNVAVMKEALRLKGYSFAGKPHFSEYELNDFEKRMRKLEKLIIETE